MGKNSQINVRIERTLRRMLDNLAEREGRTTSDWCRRLLSEEATKRIAEATKEQADGR